MTSRTSISKSIIIYLVTKIWERHRILESSIGVREEEVVSYEAATRLFTAVLVTFLVLSMLELIIFLGYNTYVSIISPVSNDLFVSGPSLEGDLTRASRDNRRETAAELW